MQHDPIRTLRCCAACQVLDGKASDMPPHAHAVRDAEPWLMSGVPRAGRVTHYRCHECGSRLQRFERAGALDGWPVISEAPLPVPGRLR